MEPEGIPSLSSVDNVKMKGVILGPHGLTNLFIEQACARLDG